MEVVVAGGGGRRGGGRWPAVAELASAKFSALCWRMQKTRNAGHLRMPGMLKTLNQLTCTLYFDLSERLRSTRIWWAHM